MAENLQAGDTVQLKSGGPKMTIDRIGKQYGSDPDPQAWCSWFDEKNKTQSKWFPLTSLKKVD
jgi:uncharacterized protein YodC (DUF2158 family)